VAASSHDSVITEVKRRPKPAKVKTSPQGAAPGGGVPLWLLIGVAVLVAAMIAAPAYGWTRPSDESVEEATRTAQSAAERAIVPILSYDAATLDEDQEAAHAYMTSDYRKNDYDPLFEVLRDNAPATGTKVEAEVIASGIVRSGEDRVDVLLFVNRPTTNKQQKEPVIYKDQVTVTMEKVGDDWLVDDMVTSPVAK
jgi:Mce-associated membrane protein